MGWFSKIFKSNKVSIDKLELEDMTKSLEDLKNIGGAIRPGLPEDKNLTNINYISKYVSPIDCYQLALYSDILRNVIGKLKHEIFRAGFDKVPLLSDPSKDQEQKIDTWMTQMNSNNQNLKELCLELDHDLEVIDDLYLLAVKDYLISPVTKKVVGTKVIEFIRIDPLTVEMQYDNMQRLGRDKDGIKIYFSIDNRYETTKEPYNKDGVENLRADYCVKGEGEQDRTYYSRDEILHVSKYMPTKLYGSSNIYSIWNKATLLINQDAIMKKYYSAGKPPKSMLSVNTSNMASFSAAWQKFIMDSKMAPDAIHPLAIESKDNKKVFELINFLNTNDEMQYTELRNEIRNSIGALYGVSPVFQNDVSVSGGLNNEGLQIKVTDRAVEMGQSIFNDKVLPFIFKKSLNFTNYEVKLNPGEELDEAYEKDLRLKELQIAKQTAELGITVYMEKDGSFSYKEGEVDVQSSSQPFIPGLNLSADKPKRNANEITKRMPTKEEKINIAQTKKFETALQKELKDIVSKLDLSKKPSEAEFKQLVTKVSKTLEKRLNATSANIIKGIYQKAQTEVAKELNTKLTLSKPDKNIIEALKRDPTYRKSFSNVSSSMSDRLKDVIVKAYDNPNDFTIDKIVDSMNNELNKSKGELRTIARTETSKISLAARKTSYQKSDEFNKMLFKVVGPNDNRTGKDSKEIVKRVGKGKTWDEVVSIINSVAKAQSKGKWEVNKDWPIPRPNWRHTIIRSF